GDETTGKPGDPRAAEVQQDQATRKFHKACAEPNEHYIAPFDLHPKFAELTAGLQSSLSGKSIRLTDGGDLLTIKSVVRDETTPYVWRPAPKSFSATRPYHNLWVTVKEREAPVSLYVPVDDYCLPDDGEGNILLPSSNYLQNVADCIKQSAGSMVGEVLVIVNRRGNTAMVMYKSNQTTSIEDEKVKMKSVICECLQAQRYP